MSSKEELRFVSKLSIVLAQFEQLSHLRNKFELSASRVSACF
jgi:hypothetical protein